MTPSETNHSEEIPEAVITALEGSSDRKLRAIIEYAQQLLQDHPPLTDAIEARQGEELVRVDDHGGYSIVVVERPDETGEASGPFAYLVNWEPGMDDETGDYRWNYLGKVIDDSGGA